jgi:hypothetical protein
MYSTYILDNQSCQMPGGKETIKADKLSYLQILNNKFLKWPSLKGIRTRLAAIGLHLAGLPILGFLVKHLRSMSINCKQ